MLRTSLFLFSAAILSALVSLMGGAVARADVPDLVWSSLKERAVVVEKQDGSEVRGRLMGFDASSAVVVGGGGRVVVVPRGTVRGVRLLDVAPPASAAPIVPTPAAPPPIAVPAMSGPPMSGPGWGPSTSAPPMPVLGPPVGGGEPLARSSAKGAAPKSDERTEFIGLNLGPGFCLGGCGGYGFAVGIDLGTSYFSGGIRYRLSSFKDKWVDINEGYQSLDFVLRGSFDIKVRPRIWLTPFFEAVPSIVVSPRSGFELVLRPGVRVSFVLNKELVAFVEPVAFDLAIGRNAVPYDFGTRYAISAGVQYRF